jgi:hypothetical protein
MPFKPIICNVRECLRPKPRVPVSCWIGPGIEIFDLCLEAPGLSARLFG